LVEQTILLKEDSTIIDRGGKGIGVARSAGLIQSLVGCLQLL
jgi:hypothetical protein